LFHGVGFVENDEVIWKKKAALAFLLFGRAAEEHEKQSVIEDNDVRGEQTFPGLLIKTARILTAGLLGADVRLAANLCPTFGSGSIDKSLSEPSRVVLAHSAMRVSSVSSGPVKSSFELCNARSSRRGQR